MIYLEKLNDIVADLPDYRMGQIYRAIFKNLYEDWDQATGLPVELRTRLSELCPLTLDAKLLFSGDERAVKALMWLDDHKRTETVMMKSAPRGPAANPKGRSKLENAAQSPGRKADEARGEGAYVRLRDRTEGEKNAADGVFGRASRNTVCVSTQVGCAIRCPFCASGKGGFVRNLTISEIVGQILFFSRFLQKSGEKVTNIVFMGIGEPLLNYDKVIGAVRLLNQENTLHLSSRRFSVSTAGIVPGIQKLAAEKSLDVNLAVSLHSAMDKKRDLLVPVNKKYPVKDLAKALRQYFDKTRRKLMLEYALISETNIFEEDAIALRDFINSVKAAYVVNLIPLNDTHCGHSAPSRQEISRFKEYLKKHNVSFIQRFSFGKDIGAACGQLAQKENANDRNNR